MNVRRWLIPGRLGDALRDSLWAGPLAAVGLAVGAAAATLAIDRATDTSFAFSGSEASARSLLSTLASAMLSFTGLVFSITIVALQLASSQWSPRVMRTFLRDRSSKVALATFVATLTYGFVVLRGVRGGFIPGLSLTVALGLMLLSVGVFIHYIDHISHGLRVASIIAAVGDEGRDIVEALLPAEALHDGPEPQLGDDPQVVANDHGPGVLVAYDRGRLLKSASARDLIIELVHPVGAFVPAGAPLLRVHGDTDPPADLLDRIELASERTTTQDPAFALRQLADIAIRGLSPGINDPTTAAQALDRIHDLLRLLAARPIPAGHIADERGATRLVVPVPGWHDYVGTGLDEIIHYSAGHPQVRARLRAVLDDLLDVVDVDRRAPLLDRRAAVD